MATRAPPIVSAGATGLASAPSAPPQLPAISKGTGATVGLSVAVATPSAQPAAGFHVIYSGQVEAIHVSSSLSSHNALLILYWLGRDDCAVVLHGP